MSDWSILVQMTHTDRFITSGVANVYVYVCTGAQVIFLWCFYFDSESNWSWHASDMDD